MEEDPNQADAIASRSPPSASREKVAEPAGNADEEGMVREKDDGRPREARNLGRKRKMAQSRVDDTGIAEARALAAIAAANTAATEEERGAAETEAPEAATAVAEPMPCGPDVQPVAAPHSNDDLLQLIRTALGEDAVAAIRAIWSRKDRWHTIRIDETHTRAMNAARRSRSASIYWQEPKMWPTNRYRPYGDGVDDLEYAPRRKWTSPSLRREPVFDWRVSDRILDAVRPHMTQGSDPEQLNQLAAELRGLNGFLKRSPTLGKSENPNAALIAHDPIPNEAGRGHMLILMGTRADMRSIRHYKEANKFLSFHTCRTKRIVTPSDFLVHLANLLIDSRYVLNGCNNDELREAVVKAIRAVVVHQKERAFTEEQIRAWRTQLTQAVDSALVVEPEIENRMEKPVFDDPAAEEDDDRDEYPF